MTKNWKRFAICAALALGAVGVTLSLADIRFFQLLDLKAQDAHFVLRGPVATKDIVLIGIDDKALNNFPELYSFWQPYYADAIRGAADGGAKVFVLDVAFGIPVAKWEPDNDSKLADAYNYAAPKMPVVSAFVPSTADQSNPAFAVPLNMLSSAFGTSAMANLTADSDDFIRRQVMIETPKQGEPTEMLTRGMAFRAAEIFTGSKAEFRNGKLFLGNREIPVDADRNLTINYAGPADTFPRVSLFDFIQAVRSHNQTQIEKWVKGKAVLLGPDNIDDRHATPFYTAFGLTNKWRTPGVEIHANVLNTLLTGNFLKPVPQAVRIAALVIAAGATVGVVTAFAVSQTATWAVVVLALLMIATHVFFRFGWLLSTTEMMLVYVSSVIGGVGFRFATAEKKSSFFKSAVALFVGKQVAKSLDQADKISLTGKRVMVTILFTDIRGFTAFCESKDPAVVVDLLNDYMKAMVSVIVKYHGHVNKFIGDGILAVFSDDDENALPGDHAFRATACATEMVSLIVGDFKTGAGLHSGEVVIGNVGSSDKMEFTVLGDTVNLASRLESLNKENKTKLLLSEETRVMTGPGIDTFYLGAVPVRGKTEPMKIHTIRSLVSEDTLAHLSDEARAYHEREAAQNAAPVPVGTAS